MGSRVDKEKKETVKLDARLEIAFIAVLFAVIVAMAFLMPRPETLSLEGTLLDSNGSVGYNMSALGNMTNPAVPANVTMDTMKQADTLQQFMADNKTNEPAEMANITCTPYRLADTLAIERAYSVEMMGSEVDTTVFPAVPVSGGYKVESESSMDYEGQHYQTKVVWYYDKNLECKGMDIVVPMGFGTRSSQVCYGYPTGVLCAEMLNESNYIRSEKYKISGREYDMDVYGMEGGEIGVGKDVPLLFYENITGGSNQTISLKLYYISGGYGK